MGWVLGSISRIESRGLGGVGREGGKLCGLELEIGGCGLRFFFFFGKNIGHFK